VPREQMNELTFVAQLGAFTMLRAERRRNAGEPVLIERGEVEERQVDSSGKVRRCDIRLNSRGGRKLVSGEVKRPEVADGRDPRNPNLIADARQKAVARGLPYYFTCNFAKVVLFAVAAGPGEPDREEAEFDLGPISHSRQVDAYKKQIQDNWIAFLDDLEQRLSAMSATRPIVTSSDVLTLRDAIYSVADEAIDRVVSRVEGDSSLSDALRRESGAAFGFAPALKPAYRAQFREELLQLLRFGVFVTAQKLILYRVLEDAGPLQQPSFRLDPLTIPSGSSDPIGIRGIIDLAVQHAIKRSGDFETAFLPDPLAYLVFMPPHSQEDTRECRVGEVWYQLQEAVKSVSWVSISQNLIGFIYEIIVDPQFRHELGQFYTREDVVDILVTYGIEAADDCVLDPAAGGGSFLRSAYKRKRDLGHAHQDALSSIWAFEITAFAAELSTLTLATADPSAPAAYPRVILRDFFEARPGLMTELRIPGDSSPLTIPERFDAIIGNPPYISYRRQTNQTLVLRALAELPEAIELPRFSGKSDAYVWFIVHATQFLTEGGRLSFVVSSAILFSDYGIPLIRFIARHYRIRAVVDSIVERWFPDADTNTVLLLLERNSNVSARRDNTMRFVRLRRPLSRLLPSLTASGRRDALEQLVDSLLTAPSGEADPRMTVRHIPQGIDGGLQFVQSNEASDEEEEFL